MPAAYVRNYPKSENAGENTECSPTLTKNAADRTRSPIMSWLARPKKN
jgi:hypothetical protein